MVDAVISSCGGIEEDFIITKVENIRTLGDGKISVFKIYYKDEEFYFYEVEKNKKVFISIKNNKKYFKDKTEFIEFFKNEYIAK